MDPLPAYLLPTFSLRPSAAEITFPGPVPEAAPAIAARLEPGAFPEVPIPDEALRRAVRDGLRGGGFRPSGRSKPASEYLVRAAREGLLRPIHPIVDACNAASLATGIPASVVDMDRTSPPLRIAVPAAKATYVFNRTGQSIDVGGLPCLFDGDGPCACAVKDAQRTKVLPGTRRTLFLAWAPAAYEDRGRLLLDLAARLLGPLGATFTEVAIHLRPRDETG